MEMRKRFFVLSERGSWMRKWLFGFLGVALIVFCSVFGYVSYQKHEGEVFKQNIEKKDARRSNQCTRKEL